ncbi:hypothetical protein BC829DRAFT_446997 [Chytridium lagenaria]|nr:hypothetical protein BC829DRAFT_446997 [Chytridium lagenaria]
MATVTNGEHGRGWGAGGARVAGKPIRRRLDHNLDLTFGISSTLVALSDNNMMMMRKTSTLKELIKASKEARLMQREIPDSVLSKLKSKPNTLKRATHHPHNHLEDTAMDVDERVLEWFTTIARIFTDFFARTKRHGNAIRPPDSYFRCASTLIYNEMLSIITSSIHDYTSLFNYYPILPPEDEIPGVMIVDMHPHAPRFIVRLCLEKGEMEFDPVLSDIGEAVVECLDFCVKTIETAIAAQQEAISACLSTTNAESVMKIICEPMVVRNALEHLQRYCKESFKVVEEKFFGEERTFEEYTTTSARIELPMVELWCDEFHRELSTIAMDCSNKLLNRIVSQTQEHEKSICLRYEFISSRALTVPENIKEMAEQMEYMEIVRNQELPSLVEELEEVRKRILYIVNFSAMTEEHIQLNNTTFTWPDRILSILESHNKIMGAAREKSEAQ